MGTTMKKSELNFIDSAFPSHVDVRDCRRSGSLAKSGAFEWRSVIELSGTSPEMQPRHDKDDVNDAS